MPRGKKRESITDFLKGTKKPLKGSYTPALSDQEFDRQNNILDYYGFGKKDVEQALEQAVTELKDEVEGKVTSAPKKPEASGPDLRQLVDEIKSALRQGFEANQPQIRGTNALQEALITELRKLGKIDVPAPIVEVTAPEQPVTPPIKRVVATNITRDVNGNIAGAEFEIER
jgi:hypothetical protein